MLLSPPIAPTMPQFIGLLRFLFRHFGTALRRPRGFLPLCLLLGCVAPLPAQLPLTGDHGIHDPSTLIKDGNRYYTFGTGDGIRILSSTDMRNWSASRVFATPPAWTTLAVPSFEGFFWAPDVAYFNGRYHVYYSISNWETIDSAIGLVTTPSLQSPVWTDHGKVVQSDASWEATPDTDYTQYNCIDASVLVDTDGRVWLVFGSYSNGIVIVEIDPATGKRLNNVTTRIANNGPAFFTNTTEAAHLYKRDGFYYLFVNFGGCCSGTNSTYNIRVGRSANVTGPYLDKNGVNLTNAGGTMLFDSTARHLGPGHAGVFQENGRFWFSHHYYDGIQNGAPLLGIRELIWGPDGWPVLRGDWSTRYTFDIDGRDQTGPYPATLAGGAAVVTDPLRGKVLSLGGSAQHATFPLSVANARTFSAWVKWNGGAAWQRIFDFGASTTAYFYLTPSSASGTLRFAIANGGAEQVLEAPAALPADQWCHVAVTLDGAKGVLYLDGVPVATGAITHRPWELLARNLYLGRSQFATDPYFAGSIDDFRVHGRALGGGEIAQLAGVRVGGTRTVAYWNFEEGAANTYVPYAPAAAGAYDGGIRDGSGNTNALSAWSSSLVWYRAATPASATPATGLANTRSIQNANEVPSLSAIGTSLTTWLPARWTIEAAIRPDGVSGYQTFVGRDSFGAHAANPALAALYFSVRPGGVLAIAFTDVAGNHWNLESAVGAIAPAQWQAVAATCDGRTLRLHRRNLTAGATAYTLLGTLDISASANSALTLGAGDGATWDRGVFTVGRGLFNGVHADRFLGHIDDVRLSDTALTPAEFLYRPAATVAHWNFEEGAANTYVSYTQPAVGAYDGSVLDVSGNANPLSAWGANLHWYRNVVPAPLTPRTGAANILSIQNANTVPSLSAIGTSLTAWSPSEWTIEAAIRPNGVSGYQTFVGRDSLGAHDGNLALSALYFSARPNGVLAVSFTDGDGHNWNLDSSANTIAAGQWHAVAATSDGDTLRLYSRNITAGSTAYALVGTLDISAGANPALSTGAGDGSTWDAGVITVGRGLFNGAHTDRFLGYLDDIRLSSAALPPEAFLYSIPPLASPTGLSATAGNAQASLTWNAVAGATAYRVKRAAISGGPYATIATALTSTSYTDSGLTNGATYYYVVSATSSLTESPDSAEVSATPLSPAQSWRQLHFGTTAATDDAADNADPDGDGIVNLLERAFGGAPLARESNLVPVIDTSAPALSLVYRRSAAAADLSFTIQETTDLTAWIPASGTSQVIEDAGTLQHIRFTRPLGATPRVFLRLLVSTL